MASAKRKQDEKNLKILRELVSQPGNKECFDCRQRGPTYVDMTIGSFVCTSCSGILRGLTPPHRVKSISMATFTQEEINFLREHGNEYCRKVWLGLLSPNNSPNMDVKDEQRMKDLMSQKYEMKIYYLDPALNNEVADSNSATPKSKSSQPASIPRVPFPTVSPATLAKNKSKTNQEAPSPYVPNFVADFSKTPEPFYSASQNNQPIAPQLSFANFDNNPVFNNTKYSENALFGNKTGFTSPNMNGINLPPPEDRYAALKDLDFLMKQAQLKEENSTSRTNWNSNNSNVQNSNWGTSNNSAHVISNPFASEDLWRPSVNLVNNNMQPIDNSSCTNPFRPAQFTLNNDSQWSTRETRNNGDVISSSQLMTPLSSKMWQPSVTAYHANPFAVGSSVGEMTRNSNNPFL